MHLVCVAASVILSRRVKEGVNSKVSGTPLTRPPLGRENELRG